MKDKLQLFKANVLPIPIKVDSNSICGIMLFTFKGTYNGQGTNPEFPIMVVLGDPSKCGENHYFVDIPHDISFFEFMEMNFETENGKIKPFKTARLDGKFKKRVDNFNYEKFI